MERQIIAIVTAAILSIKAFAQIPNNGFENWTSMGSYSNPDNWNQLNAMTSSAGVYTCAKGSPGNVGNSYIRLISKNINGMGVVPGLATTGTINMSNLGVTGGTPFNQRPQSLTGAWQYMGASSADQGFVSVVLTKWNVGTGTRDTIASALQTFPGMQMGWINFTMPLIYKSGAYPDTALIILSSSGPTPLANSYLYVDNLAFAGSVAGIAQNKLNAAIELFPNPVTDKLMITYSGQGIAQMEILDVTGRTVKMVNDLEQNSVLEVSDLPKGEYQVKIMNSEGTFTKKFLKQ